MEKRGGIFIHRKVSVEELEKREDNLLDRRIIKRLKKSRKNFVPAKKQHKPRTYVELANKLFSNFSEGIVRRYYLVEFKKNLVRANMQFIPENYLSVVILNTLLALGLSFLIFVFLVFFDVSLSFPFLSITPENILIRLLKFFWVILVVPLGVFLFSYFYPMLEAKSIASRINQELPFATIYMAAVSESVLNPKTIFEILIRAGEYPQLKKEFIKLINEINIYGMNVVSALRSRALKNPSSVLSDLLNSLATTITSGGELKSFFEKRSQALLFEYRLSREKMAKNAETLMDIYISMVIAAPMILMLLFMIMNVSGIGIGLSTPAISLIIILGVSMLNIFFLMFMGLKKKD